MNLLALVTRLEGLKVASGTATGGSTITLVDTVNRIEGDDDYWNGALLVMLSGDAVGQCRQISDFVAATDTITLNRAFTAAVAAGDNYAILPDDLSEIESDIDAVLADLGDGTDAATADGAAGSLHSKFRLLKERDAQRNKLAPVDAAGATVTASAVGGFDKTGAFVQLLAATTGKGQLLAVTVANLSAADEFDIEIAEGAVAAETVIQTVKITEAGRYVFPRGADITLAERLSARISCFDAVARTAEITVEYIDGLT